MNKWMKKLLTTSLVFSMIGSTSTVFAGSYIVQSNDTFWKISQRYNISTPSLLKINTATENTVLYVGQEIIVPDGDGFYYYEIKSGDTLWLISQRLKVSLIELLKMNNLNENSILYINQKIKIPINESQFNSTQPNTEIPTNNTSTEDVIEENFDYYEVKSGDTAWIISQKFNMSLSEFLKINNLNDSSILYVNQKVKVVKVENNSIAEENTTSNTTNTSNTTSAPQQPKISITYINHVVKSGDNFWNLSLKYGISMQEIMNANNATVNTYLKIGDIVKVPQYNIPVMETIGSEYGEYLDWWNGAQYVIPIGSIVKVIDFNTGEYFMAKRTYGANHADMETLTAADTEIMRKIWGGSFSWITKPIIVEYNGRKIAASAAGMPHAGNDTAPADAYTSWRSGDYGPGTNFDAIKGNNMDGHFDIHFLNSTTHNTGKISESHQKNVKISAGMEN